MFNPNEEIQIIGVDLGDNPDLQSQYIVNEEITKLNEKLKLKNRYKESLKERIKLQQELLKYKLKDLESEVN